MRRITKTRLAWAALAVVTALWVWALVWVGMAIRNS
jgi:hypothetical protein